MVAAPAFCGSRLVFLQEHRILYAQALANSTHKQFVTNFTRRYFKRYPITLDHKEEPSAEHINSVNDDVVDEEVDISTLSNEEMTRHVADIKFRRGVKKFYYC